MTRFAAELWRRWTLLKRQWVVALIANTVFAASLVFVNRLILGYAKGHTSVEATVCWLSFLTAACGATDDIARSRRDATIGYFVDQRVFRSLILSAAAKSVADVIVALPLALCAAVGVGWAMGAPIDATRIVIAMGSGLLCGFSLGPALWSAALYSRNSAVLSACVGLLGFAWIAIAGGDARGLPWLAWSSPAGPAFFTVGTPQPLALVVWSGTWLAVAGVSTAIGSTLSSFVRSGGDLIVDALR